MLNKIKKYFARRKFEKMCPQIRCALCNNYIDDDKYGRCELAERLGLKD